MSPYFGRVFNLQSVVTNILGLILAEVSIVTDSYGDLVCMRSQVRFLRSTMQGRSCTIIMYHLVKVTN